jgi:hypothetical protein
MMNPEIKAKWLEALRSGKYERTSSFLNDGRGMCCLGVLIDVVDPEGWERPQSGWVMGYKGETSFPPYDFCEQVGIPAPKRFAPDFNELRVLENTITNKLAEMNDGGASFEEIADYIEAEL